MNATDIFEALAKRIFEQISKRGKHSPSVSILRQLIETMFFASLETEESEPIRCRIAFVSKQNPDPKPPERIVADRWQCVSFQSEIPFDVSNRTKLAKAADPWASTLAVYASGEALKIWGAVDQSIHYSSHVVRENDEGPEMPGMFQAVIEGIGEVAIYRRFVLLGSLKKQVVLEKQLAVFSRGPVLERLTPSIERFIQSVRSKLPDRIYCDRDHWNDSLKREWISTLCRILIGVQRYKHGGALLISNIGHKDLKMKYGIEYDRLRSALRRFGREQILETHYSDIVFERYIDADSKLMPVDLYLDESVHRDQREDVQDEITGCIRFIASLSRVDGLVWLDRELRVKGFSVEVTVKDDPVSLLKALGATARKNATP